MSARSLDGDRQRALEGFEDAFPSGEDVRIGYSSHMSILLRKFARYVAQKAASDPESRDKALKVALGVFAETKQIAKENDRAYAAGRALRRVLGKLQNQQ